MKISFSLFLMLMVAHITAAQGLYIKPYARCHQSISSQVEPVFYDVYSTPLIPLISNNKDFTLSSGIKYGAAIGYTFKKHFGFEIGIDYFNTNTSFKPDAVFILNKTDWHYRSVNISPLFTFAVNNKKSTLIGKAGALIGITHMDMSSSIGEDFTVAGVFDTKVNFGYTAGLEYNYQLSQHFSAAVEIGLEQYKYTPKTATFKVHDNAGQVYGEIEIEYVKDKTIEEDPPSHKKIRFEETISFNSLYFGIGIKYNLFKK
ncbi:MAG: porin family protein [Prevotellaceae bacterium]|jgi:hypothetical protein|nr:porin family protein [Prevotellaceae bacterium]